MTNYVNSSCHTFGGCGGPKRYQMLTVINGYYGKKKFKNCPNSFVIATCL